MATSTHLAQSAVVLCAEARSAPLFFQLSLQLHNIAKTSWDACFTVLCLNWVVQVKWKSIEKNIAGVCASMKNKVFWPVPPCVSLVQNSLLVIYPSTAAQQGNIVCGKTGEFWKIPTSFVWFRPFVGCGTKNCRGLHTCSVLWAHHFDNIFKSFMLHWRHVLGY